MASPPSRQTAPNLPAVHRGERGGPPPFFDRECDSAIPRLLFCNFVPDDGPREIRRALTDDERRKVDARRRALAHGLDRYDEADVPKVEADIAAMFNGFRSMRAQGEDVVATVAITRHVLGEFPAWAIERACLLIAQDKAFVDGKKLDRRWPPNDSEIYALAEEVVKPYRKTLAVATALLSAPVERPQTPRQPADQDPLKEVR